jgi:hypothetical protein
MCVCVGGGGGNVGADLFVCGAVRQVLDVGVLELRHPSHHHQRWPFLCRLKQVACEQTAVDPCGAGRATTLCVLCAAMERSRTSARVVCVPIPRLFGTASDITLCWSAHRSGRIPTPPWSLFTVSLCTLHTLWICVSSFLPTRPTASLPCHRQHGLTLCR